MSAPRSRRAGSPRIGRWAILLAVAPYAFHGTAIGAGDGGVPAAIGAIMAREGALVVADAPLEGPLLRPLYDTRAGEPLWVGMPGARERVAAVLDVFRRAAEHGLSPAEYHVEAIATRLGAQSTGAQAELDLLVTDAVARYAVHLHAGRLAPAMRGPEVSLAAKPVSPLDAVLGAAGAKDVQAYLEAFAPQMPAYGRLRGALARYRQLAAEGGWPRLPDGPKLRPGMVDPTVPALRRRLVASGDLAGAPGRSAAYDQALVVAVRRFQARHGLAADGVIGAGTRAALETDVARRVEQLAVNLERLRWLPEDLGGRRVVVNVPGFSLEAWENGARVLTAPVVVGSDEQRTPTLASQITRVIFNPSWTVPDAIARNELLPKAEADPGYLARQGFRVYEGAHLRLRQAPGPLNPLGRVKFFLPNPFGVYLHDTNSRALFGRSVRTFSHGCVRVGDALAVATWLLRDTPTWSAERQEAALASWETRTVTLTEPVPVYLLYATAWVDDAGTTQFREDTYGRDDEVAIALAHPSAAADSRLRVMSLPGLPGTPTSAVLHPARPEGGGM
ncbi:MAG: L,D-transpeptidase family protein [Candidatus Binatia bacterium]